MAQGLDIVSAWWAIVSAAAIAGIGLLTLLGGRPRSRGELPFGLFALAWATQIGAINAAALVASQALAGRLFILAAGAGVLLPYLLVEFAAAYDPSGKDRRLWGVLRPAAAGVSLVGALVLVFQREWLFSEVFASQGLFYPVWGPLEVWLMGLPWVAGFGLATYMLARSVREAPTTRTKNRMATLLAGVGLYVGYLAGRSTLTFADLITIDARLRWILFVGVFLGLAILVAWLGRSFLVSRASAVTPADRSRDGWLAAALLIPLAAGIVERTLSLTGLIPDVRTAGLWRLAGMAVVAYGLARWQVYDLSERLRRTTSSATGAIGAVAGGATVYGATTALVGGLTVPLVSALGFTGLTVIPGMRLARRLFGPEETDNPVEQDQQRFEKRIEAYRAALEASMARQTLDEDAEFLTSLRERFDISEREDRVVRYYARQAVVPTREGDPDDAYERLRILGEGGAGRTWLARDRARDRLVVLKEPLERWQREPSVLEAARSEAKLAARVRHPHVVEVEEVIEADGLPVLVMEYVPGGTLAERLREQGVLDWRPSLGIAHDVATGLGAVHEAGIVHRDVKPGNILLTDEGTAKLSDFGIAHDHDAGGTRVVEEASSLGTEAYMAPEVRSGRTAGDERADVYACAAVLYTCLHGAPPSDGGPVVVDNEVPAGLEQVLARALAVRPEDRYRSAQALADALAKVAKT